MAIDTNTKGFVSWIPWVLPFLILIPYAFVATDFRGLIWVWQEAYAPFWILLTFLILLSLASSVMLMKLQEIGNTLFRVGIVAATLQTTFLAMSERRHSLLIVIFLLFVLGVFLSEKVKTVLRLPYYDSRRKWWESYPKGIPRLSVELLGENGDNAECRLSNFGLEGCFAFSIQGPVGFIPRAVRIHSETETLLEAEVEVALRTKDGFGWGLRFNQSGIDGDWSKDLQDYLGYLRRAGYEVV